MQCSQSLSSCVQFWCPIFTHLHNGAAIFSHISILPMIHCICVSGDVCPQTTYVSDKELFGENGRGSQKVLLESPPAVSNKKDKTSEIRTKTWYLGAIMSEQSNQKLSETENACQWLYICLTRLMIFCKLLNWLFWYFK